MYMIYMEICIESQHSRTQKLVTCYEYPNVERHYTIKIRLNLFLFLNSDCVCVGSNPNGHRDQMVISP